MFRAPHFYLRELKTTNFDSGSGLLDIFCVNQFGDRIKPR